MRLLFVFCTHFILFLYPYNAFAISTLTRVGGPQISKGVTHIETRYGFSTDSDTSRLDNRFRSRIHIDHGFTDHFAFRVVAAQNKFEHDDYGHSFLRLESRFQITKAHIHGFDSGFRFSYTHRSNTNSPDMLRGRFAFEQKLGTEKLWHWRSNILVDHDIGHNAQSGFELEIRNRIGYDFKTTDTLIKSTNVSIGLFNDFGKINQDSNFNDQHHQIGPLLNVQLKNDIYTEFGYRTGLSQRTADHNIFMTLGYRF